MKIAVSLLQVETKVIQMFVSAFLLYEFVFRNNPLQQIKIRYGL